MWVFCPDINSHWHLTLVTKLELCHKIDSLNSTDLFGSLDCLRFRSKIICGCKLGWQFRSVALHLHHQTHWPLQASKPTSKPLCLLFILHIVEIFAAKRQVRVALNNDHKTSWCWTARLHATNWSTSLGLTLLVSPSSWSDVVHFFGCSNTCDIYKPLLPIQVIPCLLM